MNLKFKIISVIVLISSIIHSPLTAQERRQFTTNDGLVSNFVFAIFEDNSNFIWAGTNAGLSRYDGIEWESFTQDNSPLVNNKVKCILQDNDGRLWFGTDNGISIYHGGGWMTYTYFNMSANPRFAQISCFFLDTKNNLWIGSNGGGVAKRSSKGAWSSYNPGNSGLSADYITAINEDNQGNIWFGTYSSGIFVFDGDTTWTPYPQLEYVGHEIKVIYKDNYDTLWVGSATGVAKTYDGLHWNNNGVENITGVRSISEDRDKNLWFGTETGSLYKYDRIKHTKSQLQLDSGIFSIILDHSGYLWVATNGNGVHRVHLNWQRYLENDSISDMAQDSLGNIWIASQGNGIFKFDGATFDNIDVEVGDYLPFTNCVNSILVDKNNWIWCATRKGVHCYNSEYKKWTGSYYSPKLAHNTVNVIFQDKAGNLWAGTQGGISRYDYNDWFTYGTSYDLPALNITAIWEDHSGHLWFGTFGGGAFEFVNDSVITVYDTTNNLSDNHVTAIIQDEKHNYWFGTENGIDRLDCTRTNWDHFYKENSGLVNNKVSCLFKDSAGNIWVGTEGGGLCKYDGQFWWDDFNRDLQRPDIPVIFQDTEHNFWFGSKTDLIKYTTDKLSPETSITIAPDDTIGTASTLFAFAGDDIETPKEKLVYSWDLKASHNSISHNWSDFIDKSYCPVGPLSNGTYLFSVKAKDADGNEDPAPASHQFTVDITPPTTIITYPSNDDMICGEVSILGTAFDNSPIKDFNQYQLEYAVHNIADRNHSAEWKTIYSSTRSVESNDVLATWDTESLYGSYKLRLSAVDKLGHSSEYVVSINIVETLDEASSRFGASITSSNHRIMLYIPPGAVEKDAYIYTLPIDTSAIIFSPGDPVVKTSMAYQIGPENLTIYKPVTLTFNYRDSEIDYLNEQKLSIAHYVSQSKHELLGGYVDTEANIIRTTIQRSGNYILVEDNRARAGKGLIAELNCQPRIFSPGGTGFAEQTTISFKLTVDSRISIKIYNMAGRLVDVILENEILKANYNPIPWNGRDYNGNICASDLYIITVQSEHEVKTQTVVILNKAKH